MEIYVTIVITNMIDRLGWMIGTRVAILNVDRFMFRFG